MFPVKGLSISADKLKIEAGASIPIAASPASKPARKRKRPNQESVTAANFADLWEKVIEHKGSSKLDAKKQAKKDNKRQKKDHEPSVADSAQILKSSDQPGKKQNKAEKKKSGPAIGTAEAIDDADKDEWSGFDDEDAPEVAPKSKQKPSKKQKGQKRGVDGTEDAKFEEKRPNKISQLSPQTSNAPKLTPLQASMREKLISARFRHLNETLYTRPSAEAFQLFEESPEMFTEYHEGFRRQVDVWPENPVDAYIADLKARAKVRFQPRGNNGPLMASQLPLPKPPHNKFCTVADLGCGDAKLAATLQPVSRKLHLDIRSFDLQTGGSPHVTQADIANLPLADNSVDVVIFCLALMGTNWLSFVEEAYRVLRWRGELWIAEIKSRFSQPSKSASKVVAHSVGNRKKQPSAAATKQAKAIAAEAEEAANLAELAVQVDEADAYPQSNPGQQHSQETDITAFLEALGKRGFLLNRDLGDGAVDMSNRMFVRMHLVKAAPALRGKCAAPGAEERAQEGAGAKKKWTDGKGRPVAAPKKKKFIDDENDTNGVDNERAEAALLKPCVYKLR